MGGVVRLMMALAAVCAVAAGVFLLAGLGASTHHSTGPVRVAAVVVARNVSRRDAHHARTPRGKVPTAHAVPRAMGPDQVQGQACLIATAETAGSVPTCGIQACSEPIAASPPRRSRGRLGSSCVTSVPPARTVVPQLRRRSPSLRRRAERRGRRAARSFQGRRGAAAGT